MNKDIASYNKSKTGEEKKICDFLAQEINATLHYTESKIWHAHPVWFIEGNPIVGYSALKSGIQLLFWSGASFDETELTPGTGKFKDASIRYTEVSQIQKKDLKRWLKKAETIQWDYKNIVKRKGKLVRLR